MASGPSPTRRGRNYSMTTMPPFLPEPRKGSLSILGPQKHIDERPPRRRLLGGRLLACRRRSIIEIKCFRLFRDALLAPLSTFFLVVALFPNVAAQVLPHVALRASLGWVTRGSAAGYQAETSHRAIKWPGLTWP
jgi:hypothetical protein